MINDVVESIGMAVMQADGTITLRLRAAIGSGCAHGELHYRRGSDDYQEILEHIGGLVPGQTKPVPPWTE